MEEPQHEQHAPTEVAAEPRYKTLGVRLDESLHAQLSFIAQLEGSTIADEIRRSIEGRVQAAQDDPELVARAAAVNAELERQAQARRAAIAGFFGPLAVDAAAEQPGSQPTPAPHSGGRRGPRTAPTPASAK